jgi:multidrug efflux system membrane fusion protein
MRLVPISKRSVSISLALLLLFAAAGCSRQGGRGERPPGMDLVPVSVAAVVRKHVPIQLTAIGNVEASSTVSIRSQVAGQLIRVHFTEGQEVAQGTLLFEIDPQSFEAEVSRVEANLARDRAQLQQAEANLVRDTAQAKNASLTKQRYQSLSEKGILPKDQFDSASTNLDALEAIVSADRAAIENARQAISADKSALESAKIPLSYCAIRAPIEGRTGSLMINQGNIIKASDLPLVVITQVHPIYVTFSVPEGNLTDIKRYWSGGNLKVEAIVPQDQAAPENGVLSFLDNTVDTQTGTIRLKATFANQSSRLWPGQFVNVTLTLGQQTDALVVPTEALQSGQTGPFIFVVRADLSAESRPVTPGRVFGGETVIERGLQPGERVVTDGQLRLVPGAKVQIKEPVGGKQERS